MMPKASCIDFYLSIASFKGLQIPTIFKVQMARI